MTNHNVVIGLNQGKEYYLSFEDRLNNSVVIGPTGCGKYHQITKPMLNQDIRNNNIAIISIDPKEFMSREISKLCEYHGRKVVVFDHYIKDNAVKFNPLKENIQDCKKILIDGLNSQEKLNKYYLDFYEKFLENSLYIVKKVYGDKSNLMDFYHIISNDNNYGIEIIRKLLEINTNTNTLNKDYRLASWFINNYYNDTNEFSKSISLRSKIEKIISNKYTKNLLVLSRNDNNVLDITSIIKNKQVLSIDIAYGYFKELGPFLANMLLSYIEICVTTSELLNKEDNVCLYIDEPQMLLPDKLLSILGDEVKINLATTLSIQDINVFSINPNQLETQHSIIKKCSNSFIFCGISEQTIRYYLDLIDANSKTMFINEIEDMKFADMLFLQQKENISYRKLRIKYIMIK